VTNELAVRRATEADAEVLVALVNSAYRGDSSKAGWTTEAELLGGQRIDLEKMRETIAAPDSVVLVHDGDGEPLGCILVERTGDEAYVGMLTVRPTLQGSGLGRRLLGAAERWARDHWGARAIHGTVIAQRPELIAYYERYGFQRTGERKPFPYGDERFGVPKRDDLEFEVLRKELGDG
jgi:ribosomal protein S18 acetylase RimI-like enzyme